MSKLTLLSATAILCIIGMCLGGHATYAEGRANLENESRPSKRGLAISLKVLQDRLRDYHDGNTIPESLTNLAGMTRLLGYVVDQTNRDVVLVGEVEGGSPALHLEDLVIALRNCWLKYAPLEGNTYIYTSPGCSIDPDPLVTQQLTEVGRRLFELTASGQATLQEIESAIERWHTTCHSPQQVRVLGIPFHSRFAQVMVKADYDMKMIADGSDPLDIPKFSSHTDLSLGLAKQALMSGQPLNLSMSMNRFWFYAGETIYSEDNGVIVLDTCQVVLLTEEEYLSNTGQIMGTGRVDPLAKQFADDFTTYFSAIAVERPVYRELWELYRIVALTKIIKLKNPQDQVGLNLDYLLNQFQFPETHVDPQLPGRSNVKTLEHTREYDGGQEISRLWLPSCGGVSMHVEVDEEDIEKDTTGKLSDLVGRVMDSRPGSDALSWEIPLL